MGWLLQAKPVKRRISFEQFLDVIAACADKKGVETRDLLHIILNKGGPESSGAKAQSVRLYDDKVCSALKEVGECLMNCHTMVHNPLVKDLARTQPAT